MQVKNHQDQKKVDIPRLGGTVHDGPKKEVNLDTLAIALRSGAHVVHPTPLFTISFADQGLGKPNGYLSFMGRI